MRHNKTHFQIRFADRFDGIPREQRQKFFSSHRLLRYRSNYHHEIGASDSVPPRHIWYRKRMNLKEVQSYSNGKSFILAAPVPRVRPVTIYERLIDEADGGKNAQHWSSSSLAVREAVSFH